MPAQATGNSAPIAFADRDGIIESVHFGIAIALDADGEETARVGEPIMPIYPRSALKPFQAQAMVEAGLDLPADLLALVASSHTGQPMHLAGVSEILTRHGLDETDLQNTPTLPRGERERETAVRSGIAPSSLQQCCSGKHAGMLATCRINGWPTDTYLQPDHPLQRRIVEVLDRFGALVAATGLDGCGAPAHVVRVDHLANAARRLVRSGSPVVEAMRARPEMVAGEDHDVTRWMRAVPGLLAKDGADAVELLALADGSAAVYKVLDGSDRARRAVAVEALRRLGVDLADDTGGSDDGFDGDASPDDAVTSAGLASLARGEQLPVLGHGHPVGRLRPLAWESTAR